MSIDNPYIIIKVYMSGGGRDKQMKNSLGIWITLIASTVTQFWKCVFFVFCTLSVQPTLLLPPPPAFGASKELSCAWVEIVPVKSSLTPALHGNKWNYYIIKEAK